MIYRFLADAVLALHLAFILFVVLGGFLVWHYPRLAWLHLPSVVWGAFVEITGHVCPLTPLEYHLRVEVDNGDYAGGFIEHYLLPMIYPEMLTREFQILLGLGVIVINVAAYALGRNARRRQG